MVESVLLGTELDARRRLDHHHRPVELVGHAETVETIVGVLSPEMEQREGSPTLHSTSTIVVGQVELQRQSKLRIDRVDVEVRTVIDGQHDVRNAEDLDAYLSEVPVLLQVEHGRQEDVEHFDEMRSATDHVDRQHADDHQCDAKVRVLLAIVGEGGVLRLRG